MLNLWQMDSPHSPLKQVYIKIIDHDLTSTIILNTIRNLVYLGSKYYHCSSPTKKSIRLWSRWWTGGRGPVTDRAEWTLSLFGANTVFWFSYKLALVVTTFAFTWTEMIRTHHLPACDNKISWESTHLQVAFGFLWQGNSKWSAGKQQGSENNNKKVGQN